MRVLVGYASAHESTKGIAGEIGDRLIKAGLPSDVRSIDEIQSLETYDAVVIGSAVHNMLWLPHAAAFVRAHATELALRPVWLFSVSSVGDTSSFLGPRDHRYFAGAIERTHWNFVGDLFLKACGGSYGDHRDWRDIAAWADGIARQLHAADDARDERH